MATRLTSKAERSVNITKSVFENSAIDIRSTESNLNVTVSNCTFSSSNSLAALSMLTPDFHEGAYHISRITIANLQITDTLFQDNINTQHNLIVIYTNLMIDNCCFMNNSLAYGDGSIFVFSSLLTLKNTTFLHSVGVHGSAFHLSCSRGTIDACLFLNNSARQSVVDVEHSSLSISNTIFEENSGTALYVNIETLKLTISNCTFRNNYDIMNGGALQVENSVFVNIYDLTFSFNKAKHDGGAIYCVDSTIFSGGQIYSFSNSAENGGYAYFSNCHVLTGSEYFDDYYSNNRASNGGAIYAERESYIYFQNNVTMTDNIASKNGGAFYLDNLYNNVLERRRTASHLFN